MSGIFHFILSPYHRFFCISYAPIYLGVVEVENIRTILIIFFFHITFNFKNVIFTYFSLSIRFQKLNAHYIEIFIYGFM